MWWKEDMDFEILHYSKNCIHKVISSSGDRNVKWYLTGTYGHPKASRRPRICEFLINLRIGEVVLCMIFSDFNEILTSFEKWGGRFFERCYWSVTCMIWASRGYFSPGIIIRWRL